MGSDECHFNASLILMDKVTRQCPQTTTFFEEEGEPKRIRTEVPLLTSLTNALPLGLIGSLLASDDDDDDDDDVELHVLGCRLTYY